MNFLLTDNHEERLLYMTDLAKKFHSKASEIDESGSFPFTNFDDLKKTGYTALTIPQRFGGKDISLLELVQLQERLAEGDGSTALSIGWHMGIIQNLAEKNIWEESLFQSVCEQVKEGALINSAATEPQTGSPTRGGRPQTTAEKAGSKWVLNGRKTFTTMAPVLDLFIVSAAIKDSEEVGNFLIPRNLKGIKIEETWDSVAMRGTGSHDLILENIEVDSDFFVERIEPGNKKANGWLLHIPACYLGIAQAAQTYAVQFAKEYSPNSINGAIVEIPAVRQKIGEMELKLMTARTFLYTTASKWDEINEQEKQQMKAELGAAKMVVTNNSIDVVDLAMRIVGARSLSLKNPLQRYYRDVRAGLHNPPMDDMTVELLAQQVIAR